MNFINDKKKRKKTYLNLITLEKKIVKFPSILFLNVTLSTRNTVKILSINSKPLPIHSFIENSVYTCDMRIFFIPHGSLYNNINPYLMRHKLLM